MLIGTEFYSVQLMLMMMDFIVRGPCPLLCEHHRTGPFNCDYKRISLLNIILCRPFVVMHWKLIN